MAPSELIQLLLILWFFIPLILLVAIWCLPWFKGSLGNSALTLPLACFPEGDYAPNCDGAVDASLLP